jgi:DNA-directed RNA polymerase subunit RPC12/RpoP
MKIKFWTFEYEFDKDDAKIVIPVILLLIAMLATNIDRTIMIQGATCYYLLYFFLDGLIRKLKSLLPKPKLKCPKCKSRKIILQGYGTYKSDEHHAFYLCTKCKTTSILTEGGLTYE